MPGRTLGGSRLNFAGGFSTRSHCSLQIGASSYLSTSGVVAWDMFRGDGMGVLRRRAQDGEEKTS